MPQKTILTIVVFIATLLTSCSAIQRPKPKSWSEIAPTAMQSIAIVKVMAHSEFLASILGEEITGLFPSSTMVLSATGTAFAVSKDGYFITNFHVIYPDIKDTRTEIWLQSPNGKEYEVKKAYAFPIYDLVVLKVEEDVDFLPLQVERETSTKIGDEVLSFCTSYRLPFSVIPGIISHTAREPVGIPFGFNWMQMTAQIHPGCSGGPVLNRYGKVVGINHAVLEPYPMFSFIIPSKYLGVILDKKVPELIKQIEQQEIKKDEKKIKEWME